MASDPRDHSVWKPQELPDNPREAFLIINEWAKALKEWELRVRAACSIMAVHENISQEQFANVVTSIKRGCHSPSDVRRALGEEKDVTTGMFLKAEPCPEKAVVGGATDVVGHPPDPPFIDPNATPTPTGNG